MAVLFNLFLDICLLRKGPQDLPASQELLKLCLIAYAGSGLLNLWLGLGDTGSGMALLLTMVDVSLLMGLSYAVLQLMGLLERYVQTLTALAGTGTLLQLIVLPLGLWYQRELAGGDGAADLPAMLWLLLLIWSIVITAHILRHALSVSFGTGTLYALGYLMMSWTVADLLLPAAA
jgi:hypothetical protein